MDPHARDAARLARKSPSVAETIIWSCLRNRNLGFKFRREHPIGPYRVDFFCPEAMLAVELDGEQHVEARDAVRDKFLANLGNETFRIKNRDFFGLDEIAYRNELEEIAKICAERTLKLQSKVPSPPAPSPILGEGNEDT